MKKLLTRLALLMILCAALALPVFADAVTDSISVCIGYFGWSEDEYVEKTKFSWQELDDWYGGALDTHEEYYSYCNGSGRTYLAFARGFYIRDLLDYAGVDVNSIASIDFFTKDHSVGAYRSFTKYALLDQPRYYFPNLAADPETGELSYAEAVRSGAQIVINTTPAGMYPNVGVCNLDVAAMPGLEAVVDVVYNPDKTELILRAEEAGVPVAVGGLEMLVAQAVYAAEYFLDRKFEDAPAEIRRITAALRRDTLNIALIGMPSSGKTTLGKLLAKQLGRTFVDLDDAIVKADGRSIPDIFAAEGEDGFRAKETEQTARFGKENRQLLSCGGGVVKRPENLRALHQNGVVLFIDRPVEALAVGGSRPLSSSMEALRTMEAQRRPLYRAAADAVVPNTGTLEDALRAAMEALDEIFDS